MSWIKNQIIAQTQDYSNVEPWCRFDNKKNRFFMNSCAGVIEFRPRKLADTTRFRNEYINRFESIKSNDKRTNKDFFELYADILSSEKVKYTANIRTRLKCSLYRLT